MSVSGVTVTCMTNSFNVGGAISGLVPGGTVVLRDNLADELTVAANGTFVFPTTVASASPYSVDVLTPPSSPTQTCLVTAGSGIVGAADVTTVSVTCTTNTYTSERLPRGDGRGPSPYGPCVWRPSRSAVTVR